MPRRALPKIRYSLKERGRTFGIPRDGINVKSIVDNINGEECQERVKLGDMQGYFGHWARVKFGLHPTAVGMVDGNLHYITPDLVTTHLKAYSDGTVEHVTELLDTTGGIAAGKMWDNKIGGFSSAIDLNINKFFGFDYLPDPNYIQNSYRGVALDSANMSVEEIELEAANELHNALLLVINQKDYALDQAHAALESTVAENESLMALVNQFKAKESKNHNPFSVVLDEANRLQQEIDRFNKFDIAKLPQFKSISTPSEIQAEIDYQKTLQQHRRY